MIFRRVISLISIILIILLILLLGLRTLRVYSIIYCVCGTPCEVGEVEKSEVKPLRKNILLRKISKKINRYGGSGPTPPPIKRAILSSGPDI
jgi:hypothetical protein